MCPGISMFWQGPLNTRSSFSCYWCSTSVWVSIISIAFYKTTLSQIDFHINGKQMFFYVYLLYQKFLILRQLPNTHKKIFTSFQDVNFRYLKGAGYSIVMVCDCFIFFNITFFRPLKPSFLFIMLFKYILKPFF